MIILYKADFSYIHSFSWYNGYYKILEISFLGKNMKIAVFVEKGVRSCKGISNQSYARADSLMDKLWKSQLCGLYHGLGAKIDSMECLCPVAL